jgi:cyanophycin synthetase
LPFEDSRRLTGSNLFFASTGAVLDVVRTPIDAELIAAWRARVERAGSKLGWADRRSVVRSHAGGTLLAISAPADQLMLATEVNEWALCAALVERDPAQWEHLLSALIAEAQDAAPDALPPDIAPVLDEGAALARFARLSSLQAQPALKALVAAAETKGLPAFLDDAEITVGAGAHSRTFQFTQLPAARDIPWGELADIPTAIVTGSNGKTTTVRLLAACLGAQGLIAGYNCTDGVFIGDDPVATGDYSGPAGARLVMRDRRTQAAILEVARGGILRRGVAVARADAAVVTNISSDHFGEYGIDDLEGLADVKLSVAPAVAAGGTLVLNADDPILLSKSRDLVRRYGRCPSLSWFALDAGHPQLVEHRAQRGSTCGVRNGRLKLQLGNEEWDLGAISGMPLTIGGVAEYNIGNLAAAALAAAALAIPAAIIAEVFARFGRDAADNPGRMMRFEYNGIHVLIDYAHNPDGLRGFLTVADRLRDTGRLGLLLGHAGNRKDADIEDLVRVAVEFSPELIVIKENESQLRGRAPGEVPQIIRHELLRLGFPPSAIVLRDNEVEAAAYALGWAQPGDVLAFPVHAINNRTAVVAMLQP